VYRTEIKQKPHFSGVDTSNKAIGNFGIPIQNNVLDFITDLIVKWVL